MKSSYGSRVVVVVSVLRVGRLRARFAFEVFNLWSVWLCALRGALLEEVGRVSDLKEQEKEY